MAIPGSPPSSRRTGLGGILDTVRAAATPGNITAGVRAMPGAVGAAQGHIADAFSHAAGIGGGAQPAFSPWAQPNSHGANTGDGPTRAGGPQAPPSSYSPAAPGAGGGGGGGGGAGAPSIADIFKGYLNSDALYQQALAQLNATGGADRSNFQQAINQLMIQYGITPDLEKSAGQLGLGGDALSQLEGLLDPATAAAAAKNTAQGTSILGRLIDTDQNNLATIAGQLAARGMTDSGDAGYRRGQESLTYNRGIYDALSRMLGTFTSDNSSLTSQLNSIYGAGGSLDKAMNDAWTRFVGAVRSGQVAIPAGTALTQPAATSG